MQESPLHPHAEGHTLAATADERANRPSLIAGCTFYRFSSLLLLAIAAGAGGYLRFADLGGREMSADEGASWAAAHASSLGQVLQLQPLLNPGKLAVHEAALHGWIRLFGDSLPALRSFSALAGTLAIVAVFFLTRELFASASGPNHKSDAASRTALQSGYPQSTVDRDMLAALGAVIFAVNLVTIKYSREARMYPLALLFAVIQMQFFVRIARRPALTDFILAAVFTTLAIACTFTVALMLPVEALWLAYCARRRDTVGARSAAMAAAALLCGLAVLIAPASVYLHVRANAPALTAYAWASSPPVWAPLSLFSKATGTWAFPIMLALSVWGVVRGLRTYREAVVLMLLWMLLPPLLVLSASYLIRPTFVERYMLANFVPFFLLVALGIWQMRRFAARIASVSLVIALSIAHIYQYERRPHDVQWREAVQAAAATDSGAIAVAPPYAVEVVRYYLRDTHPDWPVLAVREGSPAAVAIIGETGASGAVSARAAAAYPRLRLQLRGVMVREH